MSPELEQQQAEHFSLFAENAPVVEAFFILDDCAWQYSSMGDVLGLDYPTARLIWESLDIKLDTDTFKAVMLFSKTVANELNRRKKT